MAADVITHEFMHRIVRAKTSDWDGIVNIILHMRLFVNDIIPDCFVSGGSLVECTLAGYAPITLPKTGWTITPYPAPGSCGWIAAFAPVTFTFSAPGQTIYGLWVDFFSAPDVAWTKRFDVPYVVPGGGGSLQVQPNIIDMMCT